MNSQPPSPNRISYQVSSVALPFSPCRPGSSILQGGGFEGSLTEKQARYRTGKEFINGGRSLVTIDVVPEVALLEIFDFCVGEPWSYGWFPLLHVCRKWRYLVFGSSRRLRLQLHLTASELMKKTLDTWPPLPIAIKALPEERWEVDYILPTLEHKDRLCELELSPNSNRELNKVLAVMHQPFPILASLELRSYSETAPVDPDSFLGGSSLLLQSLMLESITFPELPKLLLSATHLVTLHLWRIPHSGYISPEAMVSGLSALTRLENLRIYFEDPKSCPDQNTRHPPPQTLTLLPVLTRLEFDGMSEYLEDLVARIDAPLLKELEILLFPEPIFDTPQLAHFIGRTPNFEAPNEAHVTFSKSIVWITLPPMKYGTLKLVIVCGPLDSQVSSLAQVCSSSFPQGFIPSVERLYILEHQLGVSDDDIEDSGAQWLELLRLFTAVEDIYIPCKIMPCITPVLQELVGERVTEVLPVLRTLFLEDADPWGPDQEAIDQFAAARQLAGYPVVISYWEKEEEEGLNELWYVREWYYA